MGIKLATQKRPGESTTGPAAAVSVAKAFQFDTQFARTFAETRAIYLDRLINNWRGPGLSSALDVGTGAGYFASHLSEQHGLQVTALDVRISNIEEAQRRHPNLRFVEADVEDRAIVDLGKFDLITAMGLFYHLENPFRAARNLADMTNSLLVVESIIAPGRGSRAWILDEYPGEDQARFYVAWHLTEAGLAKLLYRAGMPYVYRARFSPANLQFRGGILRRRTRTILIGSRIQLPTPEFQMISESHYHLDRAYYCRPIVREVFRHLLEMRRSAKPTDNG